MNKRNNLNALGKFFEFLRQKIKKENEYARKFAPIVYFHPNEGKQCCFPSDPIDYWIKSYIMAEKGLISFMDGSYTQGYFDPTSVFNYIPNMPNVPLPKEVKMDYARPVAGGEFYVLPKNGEERIPRNWDNESSNPPCFCHICNPDNNFKHILFNYWWWFTYNDHPNDPFDLFGSHIGDWEGIQVRFDEERPQEIEFYYRIHGGLMKVDTAMKNGHPIVLCAEGSHASYPNSAFTGLTSLTYLDNVSIGNLYWHTERNLKFYDPRHPVWCFKGHWGDPLSPGAYPCNNVKISSSPNYYSLYIMKGNIQKVMNKDVQVTKKNKKGTETVITINKVDFLFNSLENNRLTQDQEIEFVYIEKEGTLYGINDSLRTLAKPNSPGISLSYLNSLFKM